MVQLSESDIISLATGTAFSAIVFTLCCQTIHQHGLELNLLHDRKRQTVLALICLIGSIAGLICYPLNQSKASVLLSNILTIIVFLCVQYGLVILNHNSMARANIFSNAIAPNKLYFICTAFYILPFIVLLPIFYAAAEKIPNGALLNTSYYNIQIFKPLNLALVALTEIIATLTDLSLILYVYKIRKQFAHYTKSPALHRNIFSGEIIWRYMLIWFVLLIDLIVKVFIIFGYPLLFDSILSIATIALRARCNLRFGLHVKDLLVLEDPSNERDLKTIDWTIPTIHP